ncbi:MAG: hypothetical protein KBC15_02615 [Candidatus Levybacteria bacterium]|nr:hypothetical protein [Candidatus Levybacteria bacterium]
MNKLLTKLKNHKRLIFILLGAFLLQLIASLVILLAIFLYQIQQEVDHKIQRVMGDVQWNNGSWDLSSYNTDPILIGTYPLYFITVDGFVLDRRAQIRGFLDTSDFKRLLTFKIPQTVKSITNQSRRVYVKSILYQNKPVGVIAVSYFNPPEALLDQIDIKLVKTANDISAKVSTTQGMINISKIDPRKIPYDISFNIIDSYNTIVTKTVNVNSMNRIPNFIDPSYVRKYTMSSQKRIIRDSQTGEYFFIQSSPIEKNSNPVAVLVIGESIGPFLIVLKQYLAFQGGISVIILFFTVYILLFTKNHNKENLVQSTIPKKIVFNEQRGLLIVEGVDIEIPYATNQFYLLQMLFSNSSKRFETDVLLERFGEHSSSNNNRKVYDAMISINKKVSKIAPLKLILNQNKTYRLNPTILTTKL